LYTPYVLGRALRFLIILLLLIKKSYSSLLATPTKIGKRGK
jgi:hypothetical protein